MELEKRVTVETESLNEEQKTNLFNSIVLGKDATEKIETSRGVFIVIFPRVKDLESISRITAMRLKGLPVESFDANSYSLIQQVAYLDVVVKSGPAWFENAKKEVQGFSFGDIPSQKFLREVYAKALKFQLDVQEMLEGETDEGRSSGKDSSSDSKTPDGTGLFDGLSGKE